MNFHEYNLKRLTAAILAVMLCCAAVFMTACSVPKNIDSESTELSIPAYSGEPYAVINNNVPFFTEEEKQAGTFESYSELDYLGRCGVAYANVTRELMPTGKRGKIGDIKPTGWRQRKYPGLINTDPPYLYNRSHLIAYCLTAENANEKNLITGTRYMNETGMKPFEDQTARYLDTHDNHVLYRATPIFEGDNLLASGVLIEAFSVEDNGAGICFCVYCYNVQPGVEIDYSTGQNWLAE
ncbi:MAG: DNA/RNA non-specific endonuclease [Parasporobacterium sp.]|nr:DNA/RNA non-specific endonuclease [Parasporobacterium sp.]